MLGSDRFAFETPNVIDPGDLPPSRPRRDDSSTNNSTGCSHSHTSSTRSSDDDDDDSQDEHQYREARASAARLLRDIGDLDLSPTTPYDPYDEEHAESGGPNTNSHSLPTVEEARMYAASMLRESDRQSSNSMSETAPLAMGRTVKIGGSHSSKGLIRRRFCRLGGSLLILVCGIIIILAVSIALAGKNTSNETGSSQEGDGKGGLDDLESPRHYDVVQFLSDNDVSSLDDLTSPGTPQYVAADWIANQDTLQYPIPESLQQTTESRLVQRYILAVFFLSMGGVNEWTDRLKFMTAEDECGWSVTRAIDDFIGKEFAIGVDCNTDLMVRDLFIPNNNLTGSLPPELGHLSHLDMLALPRNQIGGNLPSSMSSLSNLIYLDLKYNAMVGPLPQWLGDYEGLEVLGLSNNGFSGPVPASFGTLGRLKTLAMDDNLLSGSLDFAQHLTNLEYFYADRNLFSHTVDESFLLGLDELRQLDLSENELKGNLPVHFFQHLTMNVLDLADNRLQGGIPEQLANNYVLNFLSLRGNQLAGPVPPSLPSLLKLTHLDLHGNAFTGSIPQDIGVMVDLTYLFLGENNFTQSYLPPSISQLANLHELSFTKAQLFGKIPDWLSFIPKLKLLDLSHNSLTGEIPTSVWNLPNMTYLILDNNMLTGTVPETDIGGRNLDMLILHKNGIRGDINHVCANARDISVVATDCQTGIICSVACCPTCCEPDDQTCYETGFGVKEYLQYYEGMWEFNYTRAAYGFDPMILPEAGFATIVQEGDSQGGEGEP